MKNSVLTTFFLVLTLWASPGSGEVVEPFMPPPPINDDSIRPGPPPPPERYPGGYISPIFGNLGPGPIRPMRAKARTERTYDEVEITDRTCVFRKPASGTPVDGPVPPMCKGNDVKSPDSLLTECQKLLEAGVTCDKILITGHAGGQSAGVGGAFGCDFFNGVYSPYPAEPLFSAIVECFVALGAYKLIFSSCGDYPGQTQCLQWLRDQLAMEVVGARGYCYGNPNLEPDRPYAYCEDGWTSSGPP